MRLCLAQASTSHPGQEGINQLSRLPKKLFEDIVFHMHGAARKTRCFETDVLKAGAFCSRLKRCRQSALGWLA